MSTRLKSHVGPRKARPVFAFEVLKEHRGLIICWAHVGFFCCAIWGSMEVFGGEKNPQQKALSLRVFFVPVCGFAGPILTIWGLSCADVGSFRGLCGAPRKSRGRKT